jgi:solute carrier family 25 (mitochondrial adenine nucleotide translocator), member 4/5/6/31
MKHKLNHAVTAQAFNFAFKGYFKSFYGYDRGKDEKWK